MTSPFTDMTSSSKCFEAVFFLLSSLASGPSFMSIPLLVLELWQFSFIRDCPEIWRSGIPPSEFWPISGDWGELGIPNLARLFLIKCYWMLQNARVTAFTVSELLRENQQGEGEVGEKLLLPQTKIRVHTIISFFLATRIIWCAKHIFLPSWYQLSFSLLGSIEVIV